MGNDSIVFHGNLRELLEKVETGELIPKLQASHAPMCKFFTAYYVISGIRHVVPLVHGPTGCPLYMSDFVRTRECCEIRGVPLEPTAWSRWWKRQALEHLLGPDKNRLIVFY